MTVPAEIRLLLIDDDEDDRDFFKMALEEIDYPIRCELATNARQGLELIAQKLFSPHFIFLDLNMPGIDGRACLKELKTNEETQPIPVVIFTTSSEQHDIEETKKMGAMEFMTKPRGLDQLVNKLNTFLKNNLNNQNKLT